MENNETLFNTVKPNEGKESIEKRWAALKASAKTPLQLVMFEAAEQIEKFSEAVKKMNFEPQKPKRKIIQRIKK